VEQRKVDMCETQDKPEGKKYVVMPVEVRNAIVDLLYAHIPCAYGQVVGKVATALQRLPLVDVQPRLETEPESKSEDAPEAPQE